MHAIKVNILFIIIIGIHLHVFGQKSLVIRAGVNMNNQLEGKFSTEELNPGMLFSAGLMNDFTKRFGSGLELSYVEKAALHEVDSVEVIDKNQYLELGVSVRLKKRWESSSIYLTGGMLLSFWQGASRTFKEDTKDRSESLAFPDARSKLDVGMYLGAGFSYKGILLELRTHQGLIDISNDNYDNTPVFNQGISLSLGYAFRLDD